jgi:Condensation domain
MGHARAAHRRAALIPQRHAEAAIDETLCTAHLFAGRPFRPRPRRLPWAPGMACHPNSAPVSPPRQVRTTPQRPMADLDRLLAAACPSAAFVRRYKGIGRSVGNARGPTSRADVDGSEPEVVSAPTKIVIPIANGGSSVLKAMKESSELAGTSAADLVRPVGAFERLFFRHAMRNPMHFTVIADFSMCLDADRLQRSLRAVQRRHPLLSVQVEDRPGGRLGFYRPKRVAPIEIVTRECPDGDWTPLVSSELARPFDRSRAPLIRAAIAKTPKGSALLLTFDHTVADGISSMLILRDVVTGLSNLTEKDVPVPASQEQLIDRMLSHVKEFDDSELPAGDVRMVRPSSLRPFNDVPTRVQSLEMTQLETAQLVHRCSTENTTVHGAIAVAASRVRSTDHGENFVRVETPINFRSHIRAMDDCADYFTANVTGIAPWEQPFWELARSVTDRLAVARSPRGIVTASNRVRQAMPIDAEAADAERLFTTVMPHDLLISNLGVQHIAPDAVVRPTAVWGPFVQAHLMGEQVIGVITYETRLRMVACGYTLKPGFLQRVSDTLVAASKVKCSGQRGKAIESRPTAGPR